MTGAKELHVVCVRRCAHAIPCSSWGCSRDDGATDAGARLRPQACDRHAMFFTRMLIETTFTRMLIAQPARTSSSWASSPSPGSALHASHAPSPHCVGPLSNFPEFAENEKRAVFSPLREKVSFRKYWTRAAISNQNRKRRNRRRSRAKHLHRHAGYWKVHRAYLNDPELVSLALGNLHMPSGLVETRSRPRRRRSLRRRPPQRTRPSRCTRPHWRRPRRRRSGRRGSGETIQQPEFVEQRASVETIREPECGPQRGSGVNPAAGVRAVAWRRGNDPAA